MLTHASLVANMIAGAEALDVHEEDVALSFLPLSHAFERMVCYVYLLRGVTIIFAESLETIGRDVPVVRPTVLTGVPRVYEKMHARIIADGAVRVGGRRAAIFRWAVSVGIGARPRDASRRAPAPLARAAVGARRPPGVLENPERRRRPASLSGVGKRAAAVTASRSSSTASVCRSSRATVSPRPPRSSPSNPPAAPRAGTVGKAVAGRRAADRRRRRDSRARTEPDDRVLQQARGHGRGHQGRVVLHRRHRQHRSRGLPVDYRSQEGSARHLRRQEDRPAADRERAEAEPARRRGGAARRSPQVRRRR